MVSHPIEKENEHHRRREQKNLHQKKARVAPNKAPFFPFFPFFLVSLNLNQLPLSFQTQAETNSMANFNSLAPFYRIWKPKQPVISPFPFLTLKGFLQTVFSLPSLPWIFPAPFFTETDQPILFLFMALYKETRVAL